MSEEIKNISVSEFKSWLSGVLDFQTDDWNPDLTQWRKILGKINQLDESIPAPPEVNVNKVMTSTLSQSVDSAEGRTTRNPRPEPIPAVLLNSPPVKIPDAPVRRGPEQITVVSSGEQTRSPDGKVVATGKVYKTSIDTISDEYNSQFK